MQKPNRQTTAIGRAPLVILLGFFASVTFSSAATAEPDAESSPKTQTGLTLPSSDQISLSDLRDVGLCVMQIKQQAINIYLEVTRKPIDRRVAAQMADPMTISVTGLDKNGKYLPTRPEWLTFYVGTMEPIIHLFKEDVKDAQNGVQKIVVPVGTKEKFERLFDAYQKAVEELNSHLTEIYSNIGEPDNNVKIAKEAVKIFEVAEEIEKDRQAAFHLIQKSENTEFEEVIPKKKD